MNRTTRLHPATGKHVGLELAVIGRAPKDRPYLAVWQIGENRQLLAYCESTVALRALARRILRALGEIKEAQP